MHAVFITITVISYCLAADTSGIWNFNGAPISPTSARISIPTPNDGNQPIAVQFNAMVTGTSGVFEEVYIGAGPYKMGVTTMLQTISASTCTNTCIYGVATASQLSCTCTCFDNWIGDTCNIHTCFGQGAFNTTSNQCDCIDGYIGRLCESRVITGIQPALPIVQYTCPFGYMGPACEYACATEQINGTACPFRENWMHDQCFDDGQMIYCVCGGGFGWSDTNAIRIPYIACNGSIDACSIIFNENAARCCAPDIACSTIPTQCAPWDDTCCNVFTTNDTCRDAGCRLVSYDRCISIDHWRALVYDVVLVAAPPSQIAFTWMEYTTACAFDSLSSLCNRVVRETYIELYGRCYPTDRYNDTCLRNVHETIQNRPFQAASVNDYFSITSFYVKSTTTNLYISPPVVSSSMAPQPVAWSPVPAKLQVTSILRHTRACNVVTYLVADSYPKYYCIAMCPQCTNAQSLTDSAMVWYSVLEFYPLSGSSLTDCYCTNPTDTADQLLDLTIAGPLPAITDSHATYYIDYSISACTSSLMIIYFVFIVYMFRRL